MCSVDSPWITIKSNNPNNDKKKELIEKQKYFLSLEGDHITYLNIYREFALVYSGGSSQRYAGTSSSSSGGGRSSSKNKESVISWCDANCLQHKILLQAYVIRCNLEKMIKHFATTTSIDTIATASSTKSNASNTTNNINKSMKIDSLPIASCVDDFNTIKKCLLSSLFMNVAKQSHDGFYYTIKSHVKVTPHSSSIYTMFGTPPEWVIYNELIQHTTPHMKNISSIQPLWIIDVAKHYYNIHNLTYR